MTMDKEEHHDEVQREASAAGMLVAFLFLLFACIAVFVGLTFAPVFQSLPRPPTSLPGVETAPHAYIGE